jgi:hypothetical protein
MANRRAAAVQAAELRVNPDSDWRCAGIDAKMNA